MRWRYPLRLLELMFELDLIEHSFIALFFLLFRAHFLELHFLSFIELGEELGPLESLLENSIAFFEGLNLLHNSLKHFYLIQQLFCKSLLIFNFQSLLTLEY